MNISIKEARRQGLIELESLDFDLNLKSLEVDLLLLHALKIEGAGREYLISQSEQIISENTLEIFLDLVARRKTLEPIAYLINQKEFLGREFYVDRRVLIPRPETEELVQLVVKRIVEKNEICRLIDIGTGSGCIPISILAELPSKSVESLIENSFVTDISEDAIKVAKINACRLLPMQFIPKFIKADLLGEELIGLLERETSIFITANLPYIAENDSEVDQSVRKFEPSVALFSEDEGLRHIFKLLSQVCNLINVLKLPENSLSLFLEIGHTQGNRVVSEAIKMGFKSVILHSDLSEKDRFVECIA